MLGQKTFSLRELLRNVRRVLGNSRGGGGGPGVKSGANKGIGSPNQKASDADITRIIKRLQAGNETDFFQAFSPPVLLVKQIHPTPVSHFF